VAARHFADFPGYARTITPFLNDGDLFVRMGAAQAVSLYAGFARMDPGDDPKDPFDDSLSASVEEVRVWWEEHQNDPEFR
jgi:hypothetical protein